MMKSYRTFLHRLVPVLKFSFSWPGEDVRQLLGKSWLGWAVALIGAVRFRSSKSLGVGGTDAANQGLGKYTIHNTD